jgi:hypothetical protein
LTNKISSADEAMDALMKFKSKGASVRVDFTLQFVSLSFEGYLGELDESALEVFVAPHFEQTPSSLRLAALQLARFDGDFREDESSMFLSLMITRPAMDQLNDFYRFHIRADWRADGSKAPRVQ